MLTRNFICVRRFLSFFFFFRFFIVVVLYFFLCRFCPEVAWKACSHPGQVMGRCSVQPHTALPKLSPQLPPACLKWHIAQETSANDFYQPDTATPLSAQPLSSFPAQLIPALLEFLPRIAQLAANVGGR